MIAGVLVANVLFVAVIHISVINRLIFQSSLLGKMNGLQLVAISEVSVMRCFYGVISFVSCGCSELMLCSCFEMMSSLAMMIGGFHVNFVVM